MGTGKGQHIQWAIRHDIDKAVSRGCLAHSLPATLPCACASSVICNWNHSVAMTNTCCTSWPILEMANFIAKRAVSVQPTLHSTL